jgi:hypothetical protein
MTYSNVSWHCSAIFSIMGKRSVGYWTTLSCSLKRGIMIDIMEAPFCIGDIRLKFLFMKGDVPGPAVP